MKRYFTQLSHDSNKRFTKSNESVVSTESAATWNDWEDLTDSPDDQLLAEAAHEICGRCRLPQLQWFKIHPWLCISREKKSYSVAGAARSVTGDLLELAKVNLRSMT